MNTPRINFPLLWCTLSLMIGISIGYYFPITEIGDLGLTAVVVTTGVAFFLFWKLKKMAINTERMSLAFSIWMVLIFIAIGMALVAFHNPRLRKKHYSNAAVFQTQNTPQQLLFRISERLKPTGYYEKYRVALLGVAQTEHSMKSMSGDLLLRVPKIQLGQPLPIDAQYLCQAQIQLIPKVLNPHQFDYRSYMERQYLYHQIKADAAQLIPIHPKSTTLQGIAGNFRDFLIYKLAQAPFGDRELRLIRALLLGQRQDIAPQTYNNYSKAGVIHILAVSGLHIGILFWLLGGLLAPMRHLGWGKGIRTTVIILLLFGYAVLTGLSPSVLRSVTMFACIAVGMVLPGKKSNSYNALVFSAFLLLCFRPLLLFDVGFQLSYLAVIALLWIQPLLARWYRPRYYLDRLYWTSFTVTLAAQLGLLPLSLYYFHQFPLLFFVSNLIIIPFLGIIFGFGMAVLLGAALGHLPLPMAKCYNQLINTMNMVIDWMAARESFVLTDISISGTAMLACYLLLISGVLYLQKFREWRFYALAGSCLICLGVWIIEHYKRAHTERLVLFHQPTYQKGSGNTILGYQNGSKLRVFSTKKISPRIQKQLLQPYRNATGIKSQEEALLQNAYRYKGQSLYIIDSTGLYSSSLSPPDIVLLSNRPKIHLERLLDSLQPKMILADGSSPKHYIDRWQTTCSKRQIAFHRTDQQGAFVLE